MLSESEKSGVITLDPVNWKPDPNIPNLQGVRDSEVTVNSIRVIWGD